MSRTLNRVVGLLLLLLLAGALLHAASGPLVQRFQPDGDFAADMLLVNELHENGHLYRGHYSRFGFNHPGPVFLYANALFERVGASVGLPRANAWVLSATLVNLGFLALIAWLLPRLFGRRLSAMAVAATLPLALLLGDRLFQFWMPYRLVLPYLAFYLSVLLVLRDGPRRAPLAMALAGVLIHGYVTMPLFTLSLLGLAVGAWLWRQRPPRRADYAWLGATLAVGALFALPLALDTWTNPTPNLLRILQASRAMGEAGHAGAWASLVFTLSYWRSALTLLLPAGLVFIALGLGQARAHRSLAWAVLWTAGLTSALFFLYHITAPPPLHEFMGLYYLAIPGALASLAIYASLASLESGALRAGAALVVALGCLVALVQRPAAPLDPREDIARMGDALAERYGSRFALDYSAHNQGLWGLTEGLLVYLRDRGVQVCVTRPELDFMYTPGATCEGPAEVLISDAEDCAPDCQYRDARFGFRAAPLMHAGSSLAFAACRLPHLDSTRREGDCDAVADTPGFVTFGPYVRLAPGRYRFELDYRAAGQGDVGEWDVAVDKGQRILQQGRLAGSDDRPVTLSGEFTLERVAEAEIRTRLNLPTRIVVHGLRLVRL